MVATITMNPSKPHRIAFLFVTGLGALGAVLFACSSPTVPPVGTPDSPTDGGAEKADGASASATGTINIFASAFGNSVQTNFTFFAGGAADPRCTVTTSGPCRYTECTDYDDGSNPNAQHASAGTIDFKGGYPEFSFSATPNADGTYTPQSYPYANNAHPFAGGEPATVTASGDTVPAFSLSMRYPLLFILDEPAMPDGDVEFPISRARDFSFAWSRGGADADLVVQGGDVVANVSKFVSCTFPSAQGNGTIPQTMLSKLPPRSSLVLFSAGKQTTQAGEFAVTAYLAGEVIREVGGEKKRLPPWIVE